MIRVALKGLLGRKLRAFLTAFAIVLGVATVSGTYVLTDSISDAFDNIFTGVYRGTDAVVTGKSAFDLSDDGSVTVPAFDESLLPKVASALPEVGAAIGGVGGEAQLIGSNGKVIQFGGAPNLGFSVDPTQPQFNSLTLVEGKWPGPGQFVVDTSTAGKKDIKIGDTIRVQAQGSAIPLRVSGLVKFGAVSSIGGATLAGFDIGTAQLLFHKEGKLDQIRASRAQGVSEQQLLESIRGILPPGTQVRTGENQATEDASDTKSFTSFLQSFLLAFGGIALFVGAFVIANSLSITIAQRTREFATLRTLGASRRQVLRSVLLESTVIGVLASVVGLFLGLALAKGLFALFSAVGFTLPNSGLLLKPRTIVVALIVGIVVTILASLRPGAPGDARSADRRGPRRRNPSSGPVREVPRPRLGPPRDRRLCRARVRPLRAEPLDVPDPPVHGPRDAPDLLRRRALLRAARHAARSRDRRPRRALGPRTWRARARERAAQPTAHRLDCRCVDDRPRAGDARGDAGGRDPQLVLQRGRQALGDRLRGDRREQLLADSDRRREAHPGRFRRQAGDRRSPRRGADLRQTAHAHRRGARREHRVPARLGGRVTAGDGHARAGRSVRRQGLRQGPRARRRLSDSGPDPTGVAADLHGEGNLRAADRWVAVRPRDDLERALRPAFLAARGSLRLRDHAGRRHAREHGRSRPGDSRATQTPRSRISSSSRTTRPAG